MDCIDIPILKSQSGSRRAKQTRLRLTPAAGVTVCVEGGGVGFVGVDGVGFEGADGVGFEGAGGVGVAGVDFGADLALEPKILGSVFNPGSPSAERLLFFWNCVMAYFELVPMLPSIVSAFPSFPL